MQAEVALVTGATGAIGQEVARRLLGLGLTTILAGRDPARLKGLADKLRPRGRAEVMAFDLGQPAQVRESCRTIIARYGRCDVLVNNAGVYLDNPRRVRYEALEDLDDDLLMATLAINLDAPARLIWGLLPSMKASNFGRIVNVSSGRGRFDDLDGVGPFYRISKLGLNALTTIVASEVSQQNILVNAVCPGWVQSSMGGLDAPRAADEAADSIVWAATLPDGGPTGMFFRDRQPLSWTSK